MNGPVAQIVALTCHGNAFLSGGHVPGFFPKNSTCSFCDEIKFAVADKADLAILKVVAKNPDEWFAFLKTNGAMGIRLSRIPQNETNAPDRMLAAFIGGGGTWTMEVLYPKEKSDSWASRWEVWSRNAPEKRIWRVTYSRVSEGKIHHVSAPELDAAESALERALSEIHAFSEKHEIDRFSKYFETALNVIKGKGMRGFHKDLAPESILPETAIKLLDAAQSAWVFGGMGSWNDLGFEGDANKEYERTSEQLFQAVNEAILAAANASFK